jgi:hypothetical protein
MAVRPTNEIRPAELPVYCSACFNQDPSRKHIDFDASNDRGWYGENPATQVVMDDLILCENCINEASRLLGWMPVSEVQDKLSSLERRLDDERKRADKATEYSDRMEQALQHRPESLKVSRPRGRPPKRREEEMV